MFLSRISANDARFRTLNFKSGLNLLVADRTDVSDQGDSRNGTGKSSFVRILKYLLGGGLADEFRSPALEDFVFSGYFSFVDEFGASNSVTVDRPVKPQTRVTQRGWSVEATSDVHINDWRGLIADYLFHIPEEASSPTPGQLWGQLIRTYFGDPTKGFPTDSAWQTGVKLGFFLGLSPEILERSGELERLKRQRKAINAAVKEGVLGDISVDEADLRAQLVAARRNRNRTRDQLRNFRVDEEYGEHQRRANDLTQRIAALNDEALALERRRSDIALSIQAEDGATSASELTERLARVYSEVNLVLPQIVSRRYEEVADFHASVLRNRQAFLRDELADVERRLDAIQQERAVLDAHRADVLILLRESVALDTFLTAQNTLANLESRVADLERRLESAISINQIETRIASETASTVAAVRAEVETNYPMLERPIELFNELGAEIYADREARLLVSATQQGLLSVQPHVPGDASEGIKGVETYLLDMVCLLTGLDNDRCPPIIVHDSHLFDSIDHRQVASCLNIGARLAEECGFQYIVTMNSDFLDSVVRQSDGAFDPTPYEMSTRLEDRTAEGGLFGFRFE